jgi:hypothetical protein
MWLIIVHSIALEDLQVRGGRGASCQHNNDDGDHSGHYSREHRRELVVRLDVVADGAAHQQAHRSAGHDGQRWEADSEQEAGSSGHLGHADCPVQCDTDAEMLGTASNSTEL